MLVQSSRVRRLTRALVYAAIAAVPIVALAFLIRTKFGPLVDLDQKLITSATDLTRSHSRFRSLAAAGELISQPWVVYGVVGVPACAFAWFCLHLRTRAVWALATMATGWALTHGPLKHLGQSEERLNKALAAHRTSVLNNITLFFSWTGATVSIVGVCLVVVAVLWWRTRQWWFAVVPLIERP